MTYCKAKMHEYIVQRALEEARSVILSINTGPANAVRINGETQFAQRKEWVEWAQKEVLPLIEEALSNKE